MSAHESKHWKARQHWNASRRKQQPNPPEPQDYNSAIKLCAEFQHDIGNTTVPIPLEQVVLGTYDVDAGQFTWGPTIGHKTRTVVEIIPPGPGHPHPIRTTVHLTDYFYDAKGVQLQLVINLVNNSDQAVTFTLNTFQLQAAPAGAASVSLTGPFSGELDFEIAGTQAAGFGTVTIKRPIGFKSGCITIPAVPIGIVYQPPIPNAQAQVAFINATGSTFTRVWETDYGDAGNQSLNGYDQASLGLKQIADAASATNTAEGSAISGIVAALADLIDSFSGSTQQGSNQTELRVTGSETMQFISTVETDFFSAPELGAGDGDVIVYLQDVKFAFYTYDGQTTFVPLGFRGPIPQPVAAASLRPGAANLPALPADTLAALLALDPIANGNPLGVLDTGRYSRLDEFVMLQPLRVVYSKSFTITDATVTQTLYDVRDDKGNSVNLSFGPASGVVTGNTVKTSIDLTGPVHFVLFFDRLFGTFAYLDPKLLPPPQTAPWNTAVDPSLIGQIVSIWQGANSVTTVVGPGGAVSIQSAFLQPGPAELHVPQSGPSPLVTPITLAPSNPII